MEHFRWVIKRLVLRVEKRGMMVYVSFVECGV
jgi:hypothetical protein